jgi:hypothetical protein
MRLSLKGLPDGIYNIKLADKKNANSKSFRKGKEVIVSRPSETLVAINCVFIREKYNFTI